MSTAAATINVTLSEGLHAVGAILPIDERIPWLPPGARGYEPCLAYLLRGRRTNLLIDTGLPVHRDVIISQLSRLLPSGSTVSVLFTRIEPDCIGNVGAIADQLPVERITGCSANPLEFFPASGRQHGRTSRYERRRLGESWEWEEGRTIELLPAPFGVLATAWAFDPVTGTLFTSDSFGWFHMQDPEHPCWVDSPTPPIDLSTVEAHLVRKFDWLPECRPTLVAGALRRVFEGRAIRTIAPSHGRVLRGRETVDAQYEVVREALRRIGERRTTVS